MRQSFDTGDTPHPHKGFETVNIFSFSGSIEHKDATGNSGVIHSGDVQWMTAASGVIHREFHEKEYAKRGAFVPCLTLVGKST